MGGYDKTVWWDREIDREGRPIRRDVREAAVAIWANACSRTHAALGDATDAAEILEQCVSNVSRSLDSHNKEESSQNTIGLLWVSFRNSLLNRANRLRRQTPVGDSEMLEPLAATGSLEAIESQIDLERVVRKLSSRARTILVLRHAGYDWREIAALLQVTVPSAKSTFKRELRELQLLLRKKGK